MTTLYNGGPVMGGTFPALIWASVISAWEEIKAERAAEAEAEREGKEAPDSGERLYAAVLRRRALAEVGTGNPGTEPKNRRRNRSTRSRPNRSRPDAGRTGGTRGTGGGVTAG